jgi:hypothetical protein
LEDPGVYYEEESSGSELGSLDGINLAQDRDNWRPFMNTKINLLLS